MSPPRVVIEVVSPGKVQRDRDYIAKCHQYEDQGIPEYWIVAPIEEQILLLKLVSGTYLGQVYHRQLRALFQPSSPINAVIPNQQRRWVLTERRYVQQRI